MKNILLLLLIVCIAFIGCDGKNRVHKSNTQVLKEHKLLDSFSKKVEYIPNQYEEVVNDTILSNGYHINIKMYTDSIRTVTVKEETNNNNLSKIYRDYNANVIISKNDKELLNLKLNKEDHIVSGLFKKNTLKSFFLKTIWIEEFENKNSTSIPAIYLKYFSPKDKLNKTVEILAFKDGKYTIKEII